MVAHIEGETQAEGVENRVLKRILGPKRKGVTGEWRKLHNEELSDVYSSSNIVWLIKSRRMRWRERGWGMWHVWWMEEVYARFWWGNLRERNHVEVPDIDERIILRWFFMKWDGGEWTDLAEDRDRRQALVNVVMHL